jgi:primosomal protein N' (replication factor Y) (superfamily II helicase)
MTKIYKVAANTPFNQSLLSYSSDDDFSQGDCIQVPLGKRSVFAWVLGIDHVPSVDLKKIKRIEAKAVSILDLSQHELELFKWMSDYYHYPLGQLINDILPRPMKRPRVVGEQNQVEVADLPPLTSLQLKIATAIESQFQKGFSKHLIHGVTGSGKTHIYLELMRKIVASGKSVLFLLPEINLTPQFLDKFRQYFECPVHVYSSEANASERHLLRSEFLANTQSRVVLGVRSAVFLPLDNIGLIIVDEEHDSSFKQDDRCTYNARDIAIKRAAMLQVPVILGSATPSMESYGATFGTDQYHGLKQRVHDYSMPKIRLIDQRQAQGQGRQENKFWPLTEEAIEAIYQAHQRKEQSLVFINRLGFSSYIQCSGCGHQFQCRNCSTNMRYFKAREELACQTCGNKMDMPKVCPECSCLTLMQKGYGTEKVEEVLRAAISDLRVSRFDRDEIKTMDQLKESLERFHRHEVDVMVGTQMLSKGHNFEKVNNVVVLGIDQQLNFPDFRAMERAWQTLVQVSGRSGRFGAQSEVLIQTHTPEHPLFANVVNHHFSEFYLEEIELRKRAQCPPFSKLAVIYLTHKDKKTLIRLCYDLSQWLEGLREHHFSEVTILGPRPAIMEKRVNKYTWCVMLRALQINPLHQMINAVKNHLIKVESVHVKVDVDPQVIF